MVDVSGSINNSESIRGRAVVAYQDRHSYQDRFSQTSQTLYGIIEADLSNSTLLTLAVDNQSTTPKGTMSGGLPIFYSDGSRTAYDRGASTAQDWASSRTDALNAFIRLEHYFNANWQLTANYVYGDNDLEYDVFWVKGEPDPINNTGMMPGSINYIDANRTQDTYEVELNGRFNWLGQSHQLLFGYNTQEQQFSTPYYASQQSDYIIGDFTDSSYSIAKPNWQSEAAYGSYGTTKQDALYVAAQLNITDALSLIVGSRLNQWQTNQDNFGRIHDYKISDELTAYSGAS